MLDALRDFGKLFGFCPVVKQNNLQCNHYGKKEYSRSYQSEQLKRECTFNLNIKAYYNPKSVPKTNKANGQKTKQVIATVCPDWTNLTCMMIFVVHAMTMEEGVHLHHIIFLQPMNVVVAISENQTP